MIKGEDEFEKGDFYILYVFFFNLGFLFGKWLIALLSLLKNIWTYTFRMFMIRC